MSGTNSTDTISRARRAFFDEGADAHGLVSDDIVASWLRCRNLGLEVNNSPAAGPVEHHTLREVRERYGTLRRVCRPELEALYASADRANSIVILTAPDGFILDALGNAEFLSRAQRVALCPGTPWSESSHGTNAIGTALVERRPVEVRGAEHFYRPHRMLSCSATPIFSPRGQVLGVLDMSGRAAGYNALALGMVQYAAEQIEYRLFEHEFEGVDTLHIDTTPDLVATRRAGLLVLRGHHIYAANRRALHLLGVEASQLGKLRYDAMFVSSIPQAGETLELSCMDGSVLYARRGERSQAGVSARPSATAPRSTPPHIAHAVFSAQVDTDIGRATRLLNADIPVLLQGETGTGKEIVAREIHTRSGRAKGPFVAVNCAALPQNLIESELFGYQAGAFTGAKREGSAGLLREADGGTLFLDEIGDMPVELQTRLLRVLQEREVVPLGGSRAFPVEFSLISATLQDLSAHMQAGRFRADLYYRIAQSAIHLPALRDYPELPTTIARLWSELGGPQTKMTLAPQLVVHLAQRPWPGNLRQLVGVLRSLMALGEAGTTLGLEDLLPEPGTPPPASAPNSAPCAATEPAPQAPAAARTSTTAPPIQDDLRSMQAQAIDGAIEACNGNVAAAARKLGISRSTIYRHFQDKRGG